MKRIMILLTLILSVGLWAKPKISAKQNELNSKLFTAIEREQREEAIQLMDQGADINGCFDNGIGGYQAVIDLWSLCKPVMNGKEWQDPGQARYAIELIYFATGDQFGPRDRGNGEYQYFYHVTDNQCNGKKALYSVKAGTLARCGGWPNNLGSVPEDLINKVQSNGVLTASCASRGD